MASIKRGTTLELEIEAFADKGKSVARVGDMEIQVSGAVPGDKVRATVVRTRRKKGLAEARLEEVLEASDLRTSPRCIYAYYCGGCQWQHVAYEAQLVSKQRRVEEIFQAHGLDPAIMRPTIGSEQIFYYRNKMEFSFSAQRWLTPDEIASEATYDRDFALGLHVPGHFDKVLDLQVCYLQSELSVQLVNAIREFAKEHRWEPWDIRRSEGYLRHLVIRQGEHTGEVMVNLVTNRYDPERMELLGAYLQERFPAVTTFVNTINSSVAQTAFGETTHVIFGPGHIHDRIGPYLFRIGPMAFFQTNTRQAERLYEVAREFAELQSDDLLYDLYCGAGTISLFMAPHVKHVVGIELVEEAIENARTNAELNNIHNCTFYAGDTRDIFSDALVQRHGAPDVLITDPPRAGMHAKVVEQIARLRPPRLVYVSCNPQTQARDIAMLADMYTVETVQPVDMFPHTHHIESVASLRLRE